MSFARHSFWLCFDLCNYRYFSFMCSFTCQQATDDEGEHAAEGIARLPEEIL